MATHIIPKKLHIVRYGQDEDTIIGTIVPIINDGTLGTKISNAKRSYHKEYLLEDLVIDNVPQSGYSFMKISSSWRRNDDTYWNIVTPNNFEVRITSSNLFHLLNVAKIEDGLITSDVIWIKHQNGLMWLTTTDTNLYKEAVEEETYSSKLNLRDVKPGNIITFRNLSGSHEYHGGLHISGLDFKFSVGYVDVSIKNTRKYFYTDIERSVLVDENSVVVNTMVDDSKSYTLANSAQLVSDKINCKNIVVNHKPLPKSLSSYDINLVKIEDCKSITDFNSNFYLPRYTATVNIYIGNINSEWYMFQGCTYRDTPTCYKIKTPTVFDEGIFDIKSIEFEVVENNTYYYGNRKQNVTTSKSLKDFDTIFQTQLVVK